MDWWAFLLVLDYSESDWVNCTFFILEVNNSLWLLLDRQEFIKEGMEWFHFWGALFVVVLERRMVRKLQAKKCWVVLHRVALFSHVNGGERVKIAFDLDFCINPIKQCSVIYCPDTPKLCQSSSCRCYKESFSLLLNVLLRKSRCWLLSIKGWLVQSFGGCVNDEIARSWWFLILVASPCLSKGPLI